MFAQRYEGFESCWLDVEGFRVHVRRSIDSPEDSLPMVLVHGLAVSSRQWMRAARLLARTHRVFAPDLPGYGRSPKPPRALTLDPLTRVLHGCMRMLGLSGAAVLGLSFGCQIVIELARKHPDLVRVAVLVSPTMDPEMGPLKHVIRLLRDAPREPLELMPVIARDYLDFGLPQAIATLNDAIEDEVLEHAASVQAPTLVVRGGRDPIVGERWAETLTASLPRGRLAVIPGAAHATNFNSAHQVVELVDRFLAPEATA